MSRPPIDWDKAWAHAAAILARSWLDSNLDHLLRCRGALEAVRLVFPGTAPELPDSLLARWFERALAEKCLDDLRRVLDCLPGTSQAGQPAPAPGVALVRSRLDWLETIWGQEAEAEPGPAAPGGPASAAAAEARLLGLIAGCRDEADLDRLVRRELSAIHASWIIRLRCHFGLDATAARDWMAATPPDRAGMAALRLPLDQPAAWKSWAFAACLEGTGATRGPHAVWFDPVLFERRLADWFRGAWWHHFHAHPRTPGALYAFCRLKEYERAAASSVVEGLLLGMAAPEMARLLGRAA